MHPKAPGGTRTQASRVSGQVIIDELVRNMELGQLEMGYSVLLPCVFSIYLHPDDHARLASVRELIGEDARRALSARMAEWNARPSLFRRGAKTRKQFRIAQPDWWIEIFADSEAAVPAGDVEIHSELNEAPQPGYRGMKTTLIVREPSVTSSRVASDRAGRRQPDTIFAEIRYQDDSGPQVFHVTQNEITIGRGGDDLWVDLPLYTGDEVSREHLRLRRDPATGRFAVTDISRNGTWLDGRKLKRGAEEPLPERADILVAESVRLSFAIRR